MPEGKIKARDLSYDASLPPFLQRLHAQKAGRGDLDRHEQPIARPKRAKAHDDEDEPTVVDEAGETVSKAELEKLTAVENGGRGEEKVEQDATGAVSGASQARPQVEQKVTDGTATKKRKVAKVVGEDDDAPAPDPANSNDESNSKKVVKKAKKKKSKPIKLAFDDDEET